MPIGSASLRRTHYGAIATIVATASLAGVLFAVTLGERTSRAYDLTATRAYSLSARTEGLLRAVDVPVEIVVSVPRAETDAAALERVMDTLGRFARESDELTVTLIDTSGSAAVEAFEKLVERLAEKDQRVIEEHTRLLNETAESMRSVEPGVEDSARLLVELGEALGGEYVGRFDEDAERLREIGAAYVNAASAVERARDAEVAGVRIPAGQALFRELAPFNPQTQRMEGPLGQYALVLGTVTEWAENLQRQQRTEGNEAAAEAAAALAREAGALYDEVRVIGDRLGRLEPIEARQLGLALERQPAVLATSERRSTVIAFEALFPTVIDRDAAAGEAAISAAQTRFRGESLIATAISTVAGGEPPIVVIVHGEATLGFDQSGEPGGHLAPMVGTIDQWRMRRYDVLEWAAALQDAPPVLTELNASGARPVVWFVPGPPARFAEEGGGPAAREQRLEALGAAVERLIERGENMVMTTGLSTRPSVGGTDPLVSPLRVFGIEARVGTPIVERLRRPNNVVAFQMHHDVQPVEAVAEAAGGDEEGGAGGVAEDGTRDGAVAGGEAGLVVDSSAGAIARTVRGLRTVLHWPTAVELDDEAAEAAGVRLTPLLELRDGGPEMWGESQWLSTRLYNPLRAGSLSPLTTPRRPEPDDGRDDLEGPWVVSAAAERANERPRGTTNVRGTQRVVVVGAAEWFQDAFQQQAQIVDGRLAFLAPGNAEMVDAAVSWSAHRDELIAPSPRTRDIARLSPELSGSAVAGLRWTLALGMPLGALAVGGLVLLGRR